MAGQTSRENGRKGGRPKGSANKFTADVKAMILEALTGAGGVEYLTRQAVKNPGPFLTLVGKVLPMQVTGDPQAPLVTRVIHADGDRTD